MGIKTHVAPMKIQDVILGNRLEMNMMDF
jgi:hypothetical protein